MGVISIAASNLVQVLKQVSKEEREASKPCDIIMGTVYSVEPLKVKISQKLLLTDEFLIKTTYFDSLDILIGDNIVMIRAQGGQKFLLLDKVVS